MGVINDYLNGIKRKYPNTQAVKEQIEELRDTLNLKCEEYIKQGQPEEEAERAAVASLGDVSPLFEEVSGNVKEVYIKRLRKNNALAGSILFYALFVTTWVFYLLSNPWNTQVGEFFSSLFVLFVILGIWLLTADTIWKRDPLKTKVVQFSFRIHMRIALISWLSFLAIMITAACLTYVPAEAMWPVMLLAYWPIYVYLYHKQLTGGLYDV